MLSKPSIKGRSTLKSDTKIYEVVNLSVSPVLGICSVLDDKACRDSVYNNRKLNTQTRSKARPEPKANEECYIWDLGVDGPVATDTR